MKVWLAAHVGALLAALRRLAERPVEALLNVLTLATALALPTFGYVTLENFRAAAGRADAAPHMSIFLAPSAGAQERRRVEHLLNATAAFGNFRFVGRDEALRELKAGSGSTDLLAGLSGNPLPDAYVVNLLSRDKRELMGLQEALARMPGVSTVELDSAWVEQVEALAGAGEIFALIVGALLSFAALTSIVNTVRLQVLTRREEIEVACLFGATSAFLRRPFLYFGLIQAGLGAMLAWGIVNAAVSLLDARLGGLFSALGLPGSWRGLSLLDAASLLVFGAMLGWLGALLSVSQHLRNYRV